MTDSPTTAAAMTDTSAAMADSSTSAP
jgi:hypothetical protein